MILVVAILSIVWLWLLSIRGDVATLHLVGWIPFSLFKSIHSSFPRSFFWFSSASPTTLIGRTTASSGPSQGFGRQGFAFASSLFIILVSFVVVVVVIRLTSFVHHFALDALGGCGFFRFRNNRCLGFFFFHSAIFIVFIFHRALFLVFDRTFFLIRLFTLFVFLAIFFSILGLFTFLFFIVVIFFFVNGTHFDIRRFGFFLLFFGFLFF
mmetsp:Transcript_28703/g.60002  ORF Transcript_28703/g.60002 Transcript_28703/m.60002 type:complete len:210 (+) Transcript_28703:1051-1680(+)